MVTFSLPPLVDRVAFCCLYLSAKAARERAVFLFKWRRRERLSLETNLVPARTQKGAQMSKSSLRESICGKFQTEPVEEFEVQICPCCERLTDKTGRLPCGCEGFSCNNQSLVAEQTLGPKTMKLVEIVVSRVSATSTTPTSHIWRVVHKDCGQIMGRFEWPIPLGERSSLGIS